MNFRDLQRKLSDQPFHPFKIRMVNGTVYEIREPWMITIGETSAVIVTEVRKDDLAQPIALDWRTVSISHMQEFEDIDRPAGKRKRAS